MPCCHVTSYESQCELWQALNGPWRVDENDCNSGTRPETGPSESDTNKPIGWSSLRATHNSVRRACRYLPSFHNALLSAAFSMKPLHPVAPVRAVGLSLQLPLAPKLSPSSANCPGVALVCCTKRDGTRVNSRLNAVSSTRPVRDDARATRRRHRTRGFSPFLRLSERHDGRSAVD